MRLQTEECDVCTLVLPIENVTIHEYKGTPAFSECDQCREDTGLKEFYPVNPNA